MYTFKKERLDMREYTDFHSRHFYYRATIYCKSITWCFWGILNVLHSNVFLYETLKNNYYLLLCYYLFKLLKIKVFNMGRCNLIYIFFSYQFFMHFFFFYASCNFDHCTNISRYPICLSDHTQSNYYRNYQIRWYSS